MSRKRAGAPQSIAMPKDQGPLRLDLRGTGYNNSESGQGGDAKRVLSSDADGPVHSGPATGPDRAGRRASSASSDSPRAGTGEGDVLQPANPFFDNIRQNLELSHGGITERISLNLPPEVTSRAHELPAFLRDLVEKPSSETAAILAHEFENVERDEQKRLQSIMEWHSRGMKHIDEAAKAAKAQRRRDKQRRMSFQTDADRAEERAARKVLRVQRTQSGMVQVKTSEVEDLAEASEDYFPFSITAGVERGAKNRSVVLPRKRPWLTFSSGTKTFGRTTFPVFGSPPNAMMTDPTISMPTLSSRKVPPNDTLRLRVRWTPPIRISGL